MSKITQSLDYIYRNCPIPGGGYVTGFLYHPKEKNLLYLRTDIGGVYRFDPVSQGWISLAEHVKTTAIDETFPSAIATDPANPDILYIACGMGDGKNGLLCISRDRGETFSYETIPAPVHGNWPGRGTGQRLIVDPASPDTLYFASPKNGLLRSRDTGKSWEKLPVPEDYMTFVYAGEDGSTIIAGTAGVTTKKDDRTRGHSLYISCDGGSHFEEMPEPENCRIEGAKMNGLVASRYSVDDQYLYVTMNSTGLWNYSTEMGYSCDTGSVLDGHLLRYPLDGQFRTFEDITPMDPSENAFETDTTGKRYLRYGMGGISSTPAAPGLLMLSTLSRDNVDDDCVYRSLDYGRTWEKVLQGLHTGTIEFRTKYLRPEYNGNRSCIHWLSDCRINPFDPDECWFNTGTGVFHSTDFTAASVRFTDENKGLEETVHLNVYAPVAGEVQLVDILGDLGGFAFRDVDKECSNSFADAEGNRYITCINADLSDADPDLGIIAARGNWRGKTKGGLIMTKDNYRSFDRIPMYWGLSEKIDHFMQEIEKPNVNPGWVAMSGDGTNIVWSIADGITLPADMVICSNDAGTHFSQVRITTIDGHSKNEGLFKVFSDRLKNDTFYGFDEASRVYVSTDGGMHFYEQPVDGLLPLVNFGLIDTINKTEIRAEGGRSGIFYLALAEHGLYKLCFRPEAGRFESRRLTGDQDKVFRMGLGLSREGGDYLRENKALYLCGEINGEYGFFRSLDDMQTCQRISNEKQHFGEINSIDGDKRQFGRFFIATGTLGVKYGESLGNV
ncbi:MAG: endoglucanase [Lachnospiraceae bacterium]|nr:endoglucanase [Lachnospiraceae bacterium]